MKHYPPDCPCCRVSNTLPASDKLKWIALREAWTTLPLLAPAADIVQRAKNWKAMVIQERAVKS